MVPAYVLDNGIIEGVDDLQGIQDSLCLNTKGAVSVTTLGAVYAVAQ